MESSTSGSQGQEQKTTQPKKAGTLTSYHKAPITSYWLRITEKTRAITRCFIEKRRLVVRFVLKSRGTNKRSSRSDQATCREAKDIFPMQPNAVSPILISHNSGHWLRGLERYRNEVDDFQVTRFEGTAEGQVRAVKQSLFDALPISPTSAGFTFPATGLLPAMRYAAELRQVPLHAVVSNTFVLPEPVLSPLSQNPAIADIVREFDSSVMGIAVLMSVAEIAVEICLAFPGQRILMVSPNRREIRNVFENVQRYALRCCRFQGQSILLF